MPNSGDTSERLFKGKRLKPLLCRPSPPARAISRRRSASFAEEQLEPSGVARHFRVGL
ncbi:MAG: hypothetical protein NZ874_05305 [Fimbriimonadales bacterium]|nr:hypothetical protein [Fimbriimonadales bacterium]